MNPVKRFLSGFQDYLAWLLTLLPLLTGYLAFHHVVADYTLMLALHVLSVELLLVALPFTKLFHTVSVFISRWYNGDIFGRKGEWHHECHYRTRPQRLQGSAGCAHRQLLHQLRALRPVRRGLPVLHRNGRPEIHAHPQAGAAAPRVAAGIHLARQAGQADRPGQARHRCGTRRVEPAGLRQLHAVRPLLGGLPGRQRHHLHGAQDARGHVGGRPCAGRPGDGHDARHPERQPDRREMGDGAGAGQARGGRVRLQGAGQSRERGLPGPDVLLGNPQLPGVPRRRWPHPQPGRRELDAGRGCLRSHQQRHPDRRFRPRPRTGRPHRQCSRATQGEMRHQPGVRPCLHRHPLGGAEPDGPALRLRGEAHPRSARRPAPRRQAQAEGHARQAAHLPRSLPDLAPRRRLRTAAHAAQSAGAAVQGDERQRRHELVLRRRRRRLRQRARRAAAHDRLQAQESADRGTRRQDDGDGLRQLPRRHGGSPGALPHGCRDAGPDRAGRRAPRERGGRRRA